MKKLKQKFLNQIKKTKNCWEWQGHILPKGYGKFFYNYKQYIAHRMSYKIFKGRIKNGAWILHTCDNRRCVNPEHLYQGTAKDNARDASQRKRWAYGEKNGASKLKNWQYEEIKKEKLKGKRYWGLKEFCKKYKIHRCSVTQKLKRDMQNSEAIRNLAGKERL